MIPTEAKEMKEEAVREEKKNEMRDARIIDPINENFRLLGLAYDYLLNGEKLDEIKEEAKKSSGLGLTAVLDMVIKANKNSNELISVLHDQLKLSATDKSTTVVIGDNGRVIARKTILKDGTLVKYEEFDEFGNISNVTNYDQEGNVTSVEKPADIKPKAL